METNLGVETPMPIKEENDTYKTTMINNYILNEIKSQEDSAKQVLSINTILMGVYLAFITNAQNLQAIWDNLSMLKFFNFLGLMDSYMISFSLSLLLTAIPPFLWIFSILNCQKALEPKIELSEKLLNAWTPTSAFKQIAEFKYKSMKKSYRFTVSGLLMVLIFVLALLYQNVSPETTFYEKGCALLDQGKYDEALQAYDKAIELDPTFVIAWTNKASVLLKLGMYNECLQASEKVIQLDPNIAMVWINKASALLMLGMYNEGLQASEKAIQLDPNDAGAWTNKAFALLMLGMYNEGLQASEKAIQLDPNDAGAWTNKAFALLKLGIYNEGLQASEKAIQLDPNDAGAWDNKGEALLKLGMYNESLQASEKAIQLDLNIVDGWYNKGAALKALGRTAEANAAFAKARELGLS